MSRRALLLGALLGSASLGVSSRASATCETRDGCGLMQNVAGIDVSRSSARAEGRRDSTRYGIALRQSGTGRVQGGHVFDLTLALSIGAHDEGGPPGGSIQLGGAYGRTLALDAAGTHALFAKAGLHQDFHADRALTHFRLELPTIELGYGVYDRQIATALALETGLELYASDTLRAPASEDEPDRSAWHHSHALAPTLGGSARVFTSGLSFELAAHRVFPRDEPGTWLDRGGLTLCASAFWVGLCANAAYLRTRDADTGSEVRGISAGITLGVGLIGSPDEFD